MEKKYVNPKLKKRKLPAWLLALPVLLLVVFIVYYVLWYDKTVDNVVVTGNDFYSSEDLAERILDTKLKHNTLYLTKYFDEDAVKIPFIEDVELTVTDKHSISIRVYEKAFSGCVKYLGSYAYFDKDGTVIEMNEKTREGVPVISGLIFSSIRLNEALPVGDERVFNMILELTKAMNKYECVADRMIFDEYLNVMLGYGDVRINIKSTDDIDRKLLYAAEILPTLTGKSGELDMQHFADDDDRIIFIPD